MPVELIPNMHETCTDLQKSIVWQGQSCSFHTIPCKFRGYSGLMKHW